MAQNFSHVYCHTRSPELTMSVVLAQRPEDDGFFRFAIRLREFPMRLLG